MKNLKVFLWSTFTHYKVQSFRSVFVEACVSSIFCIFIPFYEPPLYFIIKIRRICDLFYTCRISENCWRITPECSPSICLCWHMPKQRKNVCTRSVQRCSECWAGGVAWVELAGAGSQVQQPTPKMHHFIHQLGRDSVFASILFLFFLPQLFVSFSDCKNQRRPLVYFWRFSCNVQTADLLQTLLQSAFPHTPRASPYIFSVGARVQKQYPQSCRERRLVWPSCRRPLNKFLTPTVLE